ncbi:hypothetical protein E2C01_062441 [Portunus trituberculatus]|uniref:Uncharacterized protein n=1 Tax=Portunus trituberculatus TaxID=210409 RepID=A0A5B7HDN6_PORTR|nr:hypothetical protein [Portunus trituberculatus]
MTRAAQKRVRICLGTTGPDLIRISWNNLELENKTDDSGDLVVVMVVVVVAATLRHSPGLCTIRFCTSPTGKTGPLRVAANACFSQSPADEGYLTRGSSGRTTRAKNIR